MWEKGAVVICILQITEGDAVQVGGCCCGNVNTSVNTLKKDLTQVREKTEEGRIKVNIQKAIRSLQGASTKVAIYGSNPWKPGFSLSGL